MILALRQLRALVAKDLRIEARTRQTLGLVILLGLIIVVVLGLGLGPRHLGQGAAATAALWVAYLFAGVLVFEKTMAVERADGALAGLLLAPVDRGILFLAKLLANLILLLAMALVVTPVAILLFGFDLSAAPASFAAVMLISILGFAALGTLFAAAVSSTRLQGGLLALIVLPLSLPLVITSTQLLIRVYHHAQPLDRSALAILLAADLLYLTVSWFVFELILEP